MAGMRERRVRRRAEKAIAAEAEAVRQAALDEKYMKAAMAQAQK